LANSNVDNMVGMVVGDPVDPPPPEAMEQFLKENGNASSGLTGFRILSQTYLSPDVVQLELLAIWKNGEGMSLPLTLRRNNDDWKITVFTERNSDGTVNRLKLSSDSSQP
jgi:hypothetical protein